MATKTVLEVDGSVNFTKQSIKWLQERLHGVVQSIAASGDNVNKEDIQTFKSISEEMTRRGM